ncbi:unnamed protein product [Phytophthora fragariaefolia]|uniref:Unnamed protein product n=1 Tax=Phytophthora fragariaefolia TaxID=1490495 RepID=A0A9W7CV88_9STRA|nr:unnamed protein product [Phytophthora fragariaefolia]
MLPTMNGGHTAMWSTRMYPLVRVALMWRLTECTSSEGILVLRPASLACSFSHWRAQNEHANDMTQAAGTPAASAAANTVVSSSATTGSSLASTPVVTSTVTTPSSPKRTMSLGDYKKTRGNALFAHDELKALFDVGSDAGMEDREEEEEGTSSSTRVDPSVGSRRPREDDSDASRSKRSCSGSDRPLADAEPLSSPRTPMVRELPVEAECPNGRHSVKAGVPLLKTSTKTPLATVSVFA